MLQEFLIGDTLKSTWVNSGASPSDIRSSVFNGEETSVGSATMTSSGNGHYYAFHTIPNTPGFYVAETLATIGGYPFKRRVSFKAVKEEVD